MIDPDECIDCAVCVAECPVNAINAEESVPPAMAGFLELNARLARQWPVIAKRKDPLPGAETWKSRSNKLAGLEL